MIRTTRLTQPTKFLAFLKKHSLFLAWAMTIFTAIVPVGRAFFHIDVEYNEGWNVYNAAALTQHHALYPVKYGWTTVNYPMLSFSVASLLHRYTGDYIFTERMLSLASLVLCSILIAAIVRSFQTSMSAAVLAGLFCFAAFCANADQYVAMDDPQIFAQSFFLLAVLVYLRGKRSPASLAATALLFVLGGFTKHNLIEFPLVVLLDLMLASIPAALWFTLCGIILLTAGVLLNTRLGGPYFLTELLAPRGYSWFHVLEQFRDVWCPLLLPFAIAVFTAVLLRRDPKRRFASLLFFATLLIGGLFSGGEGVSINALFGSLLAASILIGLFLDVVPTAGDLTTAQWLKHPALRYAPVALFAWLIIPLLLTGNWSFVHVFHEDAAEQERFGKEIAFLESRPGPAICESLLLCYDAQKPFVYDPFNATRLIEFHKLDQDVLVNAIRRHNFGAVELSAPPERCDACAQRFASAVMEAIQESYTPALQMKNAIIYIPRPNLQRAAAISPPLPSEQPSLHR